MSDIQDYWTEQEFEDTVAAALIACYETKPKKNKGAAPSDRLTDERIAVLRREGPYINSNSRLIEINESGEGHGTFDLVNDPLPVKGCLAVIPDGKIRESNPASYLQVFYLRRVDQLGRYWITRKSGVIYEVVTMQVENDGITGERRFVTVTPKGEVVACDQRIPAALGYQPGKPLGYHHHEPLFLHETGVWSSVALQILADRRFCWTITAQEKIAKAHLGCMQEEIKSLLYARSLPLTTTGRKRPILHLVEAHRRRMKNGTDVDITAFLRGQQTIEIGGTLFTINPPRVLQPTLSKASQERCYKV